MLDPRLAASGQLDELLVAAKKSRPVLKIELCIMKRSLSLFLI